MRRIPQYKGYSRREFAKKKGIPLLQLCNDIGEETENDIIVKHRFDNAFYAIFHGQMNAA